MEVEDHVASSALPDRSIDVNPKLDRRSDYAGLGDVPFAVGSEHVADASNRIG